MSTNTTINDIIRRAYLLTSAFTYETQPTADDINTGLFLLNLIIRNDPMGSIVPYYQTISFELTANQEMYTLGRSQGAYFACNRIADISTAYVTLDQVNYPLKPLTRYEFYGISSRQIIQSIPKNFFMQNTTNDDTELFLYPQPNKNYQITLQVKTDIDYLTLFTPVTQLPEYYQRWMIYKLASELNDYRPSAVWNEEKQRKLDALQQKVENSADLDLTIITMTSRNFRNNGAVTIYTGGA